MDAERVLKKLSWPSSRLSYLGAAALFLMMVLTAADVTGRYLFNKPITGAFELTEFLVLILIFSFLGHTQAQKMHVSVDLLVGRMPKKWQTAIGIFNHALCFILICLFVWMSTVRAFELTQFVEASPNLGIPRYPFAFFVVLGCAVLGIEYVRDLIRMIGTGKQGGRR